jgi:hypothetical protein
MLLVELASAPGSSSPWSWSRSSTEARPELLGHDLHNRAGAAVLGRPGPLLEPTHDHHPAALSQGLRGVLGLVAPHDHGEERRLLLPTARHGHPEHGPCDAAFGVADLGVVGEVASEAHGWLGHGSAPSWCLAGRSALPLEPGDGGRRGMPQDRQGQAVEPTKSARGSELPAVAGSGAELVPGGRLRLGVGHASPVRPDPSTLGVVGDRGSRHEGRLPARSR